MNGPSQPGNWTYLKIFGEGGFREALGKHEVVKADDLYPDYKFVSRVPGCTERLSGILRAHHETFNGRLKNFRCVRSAFNLSIYNRYEQAAIRREDLDFIE